MSEPAPRIAIKFGTSSSSSSKPNNRTKRPTHAQPSSTLGKRQRPRALNNDSDSESDKDASTKHEIVTSLGGELSESEAKRRSVKTDRSRRANAPYVISGHRNRDWKAEIKAQKATKGLRASDNTETVPADQDTQIKWGLTVTKKPLSDISQNPEVTDSKREGSAPSDSEETPRAEDPEVSKSEANDAMDALLGKKRKSAKDLVIEDTSKHNPSVPPSEQDAYRRKIEEAAEVSTTDEYDQIPEGEFGAAMLRGMGWNGEERGSKPKEVKKRPPLMGLGSTEDEEIKKGELARKHGHRERRPRLDEYRRDKERERRDREERHGDSYKSERERQDHGHSHSHRDRDRNSHRYPDRSYRR
ncbi:DExH-box splicing factor binding site-domain-containing protein [Jackrogersella minutella]|nr:DExH-box splicing factor binding site-domain-containing protein [Jackrogersella minutella]